MSKTIQKVLVANRGEIAVRVIIGLRETGVTAVAVYSEPDRTALHVMLADEAYPIGPAPAAESYLLGERIIETAKACGADAIHPGYGFLSENADFSRACDAAGIIFIGPTGDSIELMGDKLSARRLMMDSGVPVIPGTENAVKDPDEAVAAAKEIGYPVLLKAAAGGGGKGMRVVREESEIASALRQTMGEAKSAFGSDSVFIERYIENPKHIEVQVLGDGKGHAIHVFERECSVQRRHQKVIEESPSPSLTPELRADICAAAVRTAQSVDYLGAGTVEFILSDQGEFFFLEMNTRLQVEHPITEMVTGTDLVRAQLRIAEGHGIPYTQDELSQRGWAIEFRVYAEDPSHNFAPSIGRIITYNPPSGPGVRLDTGIYQGFNVPIHYDPLLAKLVVWGEDRAQAIARGKRALHTFILHGPGHNLPFHSWALAQPEFVDGTYTTDFVGDRFDPETYRTPLSEESLRALVAAAALYEENRRSVPVVTGAGDTDHSNWRRDALRRMTRSE
jgi:acetyl-CoA carboxylase, biotin carboxylase subunit